MHRTIAAMLLTFILATFLPAPTMALNVEQVVKKAKPATVFVVAATDSGAQSGSGFAVQSNANSTTIITANHVVEGAVQVDVIFDSNERERFPAQIVHRDHEKDVAVLRVHVGHRPTISLESPDNITEGMSIVLIGYPLATLEFHRIAGDALRPSVHTGIISAIRFDGEIIQFDAATYHGDSGGPIIDTDSGHVVAIVHGAELDPSYASRGLEQALPGSSFGPSSSTIASVMYETRPSSDPGPTTGTVGNGETGSVVATRGATSASYRVGYGVPHETVTGDNSVGIGINNAVEAAALDRLQNFLKQDNALYLIPVNLGTSAISNAQQLSGYCDDARINALAAPAYSWNLTGGPRYNMYGGIVGYTGDATVTVDFFVFDCYGIPFFAEQKTKSENRYFAHRTPDREIVDMTNDLLDQVMNDFAKVRIEHKGAWESLLKTGLAVDPSDGRYHSMMFFAKQPTGYQVLTVAPNGPADRAGIRAQDVIEQIGGQDIAELTVQQIQDLMNVPVYTVLLQRPGGTVTLTVRPERYPQLVKELQR